MLKAYARARPKTSALDSMMPSKVCGMFPVRPPINVLRAMISLGRRSFGANMTFSWTDPFQAAQPVGLSEPSAVRGATLSILGYASEQGAN